jgi:UDP-N-acetylglucosamine diphosphorylase/glucosamine-1-phosphate N-acetyltransferase
MPLSKAEANAVFLTPMSIFLDESKCREQLFPFTHTRHVADIRIGILTIREKWEMILGQKVKTRPEERKNEDIIINAHIIPAKSTAENILKAAEDKTPLLDSEEIKMLHHPWHIFELNDWALRKDYDLVTADRVTATIPAHASCTRPENIFTEETAIVEHCYLDASAGPIYIGKNALIMAGSMIRGPFSAGEDAVIKMGSKIYGATTIGPGCVAGGEIKNAVLFGFSNKAHDGYLGDSVIGEWCNLGAGTTNSNVKNTGGKVKYIVDKTRSEIYAGNKAGLLMGDYSRAAINTSFNTGTIVGVCCNIFGGMPGKYVNNFSWGNERYIFEKVLADLGNWKKMKGHTLSQEEIALLQNLYSTNL